MRVRRPMRGSLATATRCSAPDVRRRIRRSGCTQWSSLGRFVAALDGRGARCSPRVRTSSRSRATPMNDAREAGKDSAAALRETFEDKGRVEPRRRADRRFVCLVVECAEGVSRRCEPRVARMGEKSALRGRATGHRTVGRQARAKRASDAQCLREVLLDARDRGVGGLARRLDRVRPPARRPRCST